MGLSCDIAAGTGLLSEHDGRASGRIRFGVGLQRLDLLRGGSNLRTDGIGYLWRLRNQFSIGNQLPSNVLIHLHKRHSRHPNRDSARRSIYRMVRGGLFRHWLNLRFYDKRSAGRGRDL